MSNAIKISESNRKSLTKIKEAHNFKSYDEVIEKLILFIQNNNFDLNRNYADDWHNIIEKSNDKTLKRIEDVIRIIRNIEKDSIIPTRIQVYDIYNNNNASFKNDVINEVKKDIDIDKPIEFDLDKYKIELAQLKKSRDNYFSELNNIRPLINELFNAISIKSSLMGPKFEVNLTTERFNELKNLINK